MTDDFPGAFKPKRIEALKGELEDELVVYDPVTHRGHCLNRSASLVWLACDGRATVSEIAARLAAETHSGISEVMIQLALIKLDRAGLLSTRGTLSEKIRPRTRRDILRRLGTAAVFALPAVTSLLVPTPASAASCFPLLHSCTKNSDCCSNNCGISGINLVCLP